MKSTKVDTNCNTTRWLLIGNWTEIDKSSADNGRLHFLTWLKSTPFSSV